MSNIVCDFPRAREPAVQNLRNRDEFVSFELFFLVADDS
jgi:hypothetical protein